MSDRSDSKDGAESPNRANAKRGGAASPSTQSPSSGSGSPLPKKFASSRAKGSTSPANAGVATLGRQPPKTVARRDGHAPAADAGDEEPGSSPPYSEDELDRLPDDAAKRRGRRDGKGPAGASRSGYSDVRTKDSLGDQDRAKRVSQKLAAVPAADQLVPIILGREAPARFLGGRVDPRTRPAEDREESASSDEEGELQEDERSATATVRWRPSVYARDAKRAASTKTVDEAPSLEREQAKTASEAKPDQHTRESASHASHSSWWTSLTSPFISPAASPEPMSEEAGAPPLEAVAGRGPPTAAPDKQRASQRDKRAAHLAEEVKGYAAMAGGDTAVATAARPPSAAEPAVPGVPPAPRVPPVAPIQVVEDYLDYDHGLRLAQSTESDASSDLPTGRIRSAGCSCLRLSARCVMLVILVLVPCSLLFLTYRLGQALYRTTPGRIAKTPTTTTVKTTTATTASASTATQTGSTTTMAATKALPPTEKLYDDTSDRDPSCAEPVYDPSNTAGEVDSGDRTLTSGDGATQFRKLLCVLDSRYFSAKRTYVVQRLPTTYCSDFIYYALYMSSNAGLEGKRHALDTSALTQFAALTLTRKHHGRKVRLYVTVGGSRRDSPSFVRMLERPEVRQDFVKDLVASSGNLYHGVNIHWDRPGDSCDRAFTPAFFRALIEELYRNNIAVLLTVPPVVELVRNFWLVNVMRYLDYVIVTTHTLRRKVNKNQEPYTGVLDCTGRREFAAVSYHAIRQHVVNQTFNPVDGAKVAYSIAMGADVFKATLPLNSPRLLDAATPSSLFNGPTVQPNKTSYDHVCRLPKQAFDDDDECVWVLGANTASGTELALFAGPAELALRMRRSYTDRMGDAPVAVFDLFLDDFDAHCGPDGHAKESPLLAVIADTGLTP